jgi:hypothetical protein
LKKFAKDTKEIRKQKKKKRKEEIKIEMEPGKRFGQVTKSTRGPLTFSPNRYPLSLFSPIISVSL